MVDAKEMEVKWIAGEDNLADFFTKKLARERFTRLRNAIMGCAEEPVIVRGASDVEDAQGDSGCSFFFEASLNSGIIMGGASPMRWEPSQEITTVQPWVCMLQEEQIPPPQALPPNLKAIYPCIDFEVHGKLNIARHKKENSQRMNSGHEMFVARYLATVNDALAKHPDHWVLLEQGDIAHLPLACGHLPSTADAKQTPPLHLPRLPRERHSLIWGNQSVGVVALLIITLMYFKGMPPQWP